MNRVWIVLSVLFLSLFVGAMENKSGQTSTSKEVTHQVQGKLVRNLSLEKQPTHKNHQSREQSPTRERVALHRQDSYDKLKNAQHDFNRLAKMSTQQASHSLTPAAHKAKLQLGASHAEQAADFAGKKAKEIADNPNTPSTSHLLKGW